MAEYGVEIGLQALPYEATSIPRETCATFGENDTVLQRCADMTIPLRIYLDMGHRYKEGTPEEGDHLVWIRRYGRYCDVIDCQQTDLVANRHWPFNEENNQQGVIRSDEVVKAIADSGAEDIMLAFELHTSSFHPEEDTFM